MTMTWLNSSDSCKAIPLSRGKQRKVGRHRMQEWTVCVPAGPLNVVPEACWRHVLAASEMDVWQWVTVTSAVHWQKTDDRPLTAQMPSVSSRTAQSVMLGKCMKEGWEQSSLPTLAC